MIPVRLTLKNFMSYGEQPETLDFNGLHMACLSGENGNGKSALLDAITWALWGRTRAVSKSTIEDDLIHLGSDEMEVNFEFLMNEQRYRIIRKRKRGKTGDWQLAAYAGGDEWNGVAGTTARETGKQIVQILNMDFDTFLNSAYLQQGRADEFTRQTPDNRKKILSEILGLNRYDRLEEMARELMREYKSHAEQTQIEIQMLDTQIQRKTEYQSSLAETQNELDQLHLINESQEKLVNELQARIHKMESLHKQREQILEQLDRLNKDLAERRKEKQAIVQNIRNADGVILEAEPRRVDYQAVREARKRLEELEVKEKEQQKYSQDKIRLEALLAAEEQKLISERKLAEQNLLNGEKQVKKFESLQLECTELKLKLKSEFQLETAKTEAENLFIHLKRQFDALKDDNTRINSELIEKKKALEMLCQPHAACPVCERELTEEGQAALIKSQEKHKTELESTIQELRIRGIELKKSVDSAEKQLADIRKELETMMRYRQILQMREKDSQEIESAHIDLKKAESKVRELESLLKNNEFALPQRAQLITIASALKKIEPLITEIETCRRRVRQGADAEKRYIELERSASQRPELEKENLRLEGLISELEEALKKHTSVVDSLNLELAQYESVKNNYQTALKERKITLEKEKIQQNDLGGFRARLEEITQAEADRQERKSELKTLKEKQMIYNHLATAFGKKGVQALIIENSLPELENEANSLLSRISENSMCVRFDTLRAAKSTGNSIETLDIRIADDAGDRVYELFSGGEAFRINFAIRIALSRLLVNRNGSPLQTLILDEGFGSQDTRGREKLVQVLESVKDDFAKVLVITHIDEIKNSFNQRVEITKDESGSHILAL